VLQDLVVEVDLQVLEPQAGLIVDRVVQRLEPLQLSAALNLVEESINRSVNQSIDQPINQD